MVTVALLAVSLAWHPLHASSAVILIPRGAGRGTISLRVFAEDFPPGRDRQAIARYVGRHFHLSQNRQELTLMLDSVRVEGDAQILRFSFAAPKGCKAITVWNAILTERFNDQVNLVQVRCGSAVKHLVFSAGEGPKRL
jgi:hypothetical protein